MRLRVPQKSPATRYLKTGRRFTSTPFRQSLQAAGTFRRRQEVDGWPLKSHAVTPVPQPMARSAACSSCARDSLLHAPIHS